MVQTNTLQLSTNELAAALALCGYESMASEFIINIKNSNNNDEDTVNRFIEYTESTLNGKGYLDESRPTLLISELEDFLHLLMSSTRKVRGIKDEHVLFVHFINKEDIIIQEIKNQIHYFTKQQTKQGFEYILRKHFRVGKTNNTLIKERKTMLLSEDLYNELHNLDPMFLELLINNIKLDVDLRGFLEDFKSNNQQFDNLAFMEMDYIRDQMSLRQVFFMLPNKRYIWHLDYDNVMNKEVYLIPSDINNYFNRLNREIVDFFDIQNIPI